MISVKSKCTVPPQRIFNIITKIAHLKSSRRTNARLQLSTHPTRTNHFQPHHASQTMHLSGKHHNA